jgi:hypothetical protein
MIAAKAKGGERVFAPHIDLVLRAHEFCNAPSEASKAALVEAVERAAGANTPELYSPLFAACLGARNARPLEWRAIVEKIDGEIHVIGATLKAGGWFRRKDIAA